MHPLQSLPAISIRLIPVDQKLPLSFKSADKALHPLKAPLVLQASGNSRTAETVKQKEVSCSHKEALVDLHRDEMLPALTALRCAPSTSLIAVSFVSPTQSVGSLSCESRVMRQEKGQSSDLAWLETVFLYSVQAGQAQAGSWA
jgi:hypothetical protein